MIFMEIKQKNQMFMKRKKYQGFWIIIKKEDCMMIILNLKLM